MKNRSKILKVSSLDLAIFRTLLVAIIFVAAFASHGSHKKLSNSNDVVFGIVK